MKCQFVNSKNGNNCQRNARKDSEYCSRHKYKEKKINKINFDNTETPTLDGDLPNKIDYDLSNLFTDTEYFDVSQNNINFDDNNDKKTLSKDPNVLVDELILKSRSQALFDFYKIIGITSENASILTQRAGINLKGVSEDIEERKQEIMNCLEDLYKEDPELFDEYLSPLNRLFVISLGIYGGRIIKNKYEEKKKD